MGAPLQLAALGPLVPDGERPSSLLRFPGACGVRDCLSGALRSLAHPAEPLAFFSTRNNPDVERGTSEFGALVAFLPPGTPLVRFEEEADVYVAANVPVLPGIHVEWVPPRVLKAVADWGSLSGLPAVHALCGPALEAERLQMQLRVNAYFEEIAQLTLAGVPYPPTCWYATPLEERLRLLSQAGGEPRWSAPPSRTASSP